MAVACLPGVAWASLESVPPALSVKAESTSWANWPRLCLLFDLDLVSWTTWNSTTTAVHLAPGRFFFSGVGDFTGLSVSLLLPSLFCLCCFWVKKKGPTVGTKEQSFWGLFFWTHQPFIRGFGAGPRRSVDFSWPFLQAKIPEFQLPRGCHRPAFFPLRMRSVVFSYMLFVSNPLGNEEMKIFSWLVFWRIQKTNSTIKVLLLQSTRFLLAKRFLQSF